MAWQVFLTPFNHQVFPATAVTIDSSSTVKSSMETTRQNVKNFQADGGTAIYLALMEAYRLAGEQKTRDPNRF